MIKRLTHATAITEEDFDTLHVEMLELEDKEKAGHLTKRDFIRFSAIVGQKILPSQYRTIFLM